MKWMTKGWTLALAAAWVLSACGGGGGSGEERSHAATEATASAVTDPTSASTPEVNRGFASSDALWTQSRIPVCWINPTPTDANERLWVQRALERSWSHYTRLDFVGWGSCPAANAGDAIRVRIQDVQPRSSIGQSIVAQDTGMWLNFTFKGGWNPSCGASGEDFRKRCIESAAIHEFGHALGFLHEQDRFDTPTPCNARPDVTQGDLTVGAWDVDSIMTDCDPNTGLGRPPSGLSATDIEMVQKLYGPRIGLTAAYFDNPNLEGTPVLLRTDQPVFNWGADAPTPGLPADDFSVRWTGFIEAPTTGDYTFSIWSDDGVRLWIDGQLVLHNWTAHGLAMDRSQPLKLTAGRHTIRMEYQELTGLAMVQLNWKRPGDADFDTVLPASLTPAMSGKGLSGTYFSDPELQGTPVLTRSEPINFGWPAAPRDVAVPVDGFSVRWTGWLEAPASGAYTLQTLSDDGIRVWVDGLLVIDNWTGHAPTVNTSAPLTWEAGALHLVRVEYQELGGAGTVQLRWRTPGNLNFTVVPTGALYPAASGTGLSAAYFANANLEGDPVLHRTEAVDFEWAESPASGLPADGFSVRWTGTLEAAQSGLHTLQTVSDDGVRVWLDGQLVIDHWTGHAATTDTSATWAWAAGERHAIRVEYQELGGPGVAQLLWRTAADGRFQPVPAAQLYAE